MKSLKILIVDDVAVNLKLLRVRLEGEGHQVVEARNGMEALKILNAEGAGVIISDILMPVMDGYRLCHEVRHSERFKDIPFIIHTATYTSPADKELSLGLGADVYLHKPASAEDLMSAISNALHTKHQQPSLSLDGMEVLNQYSERLVSKLEEKNIELTAAVNQLGLQTTALETAADAILITDRKGTILWVNPAFTAMTGYRSDEAIGNTPRMLRSGKQDAEFYKRFWQTINSGQVWRGEFTNRCKDGSIRYNDQTVSPVVGPDGEITHFVGVLHDVTERKRAEEELRSTHAQLRQLLDHSPAVIYALKVEGGTMTPYLVSENVNRLLGFASEETLSFDWWLGQLHPEDRELALASLDETLREGVSRTEYRVQHKDGAYRWVEDNRRLVRNERGQPAEVVGVWTDITESRRGRDELRESERRFSDMLRNVQLVSMTLDCEAHITYCNDYLLRLAGWDREDVLGKSWFDIFLPADRRAELKAVHASLIADQPESWYYENEIITRAGERRLISWNNTVLRSTGGDVIGTASIGEDITERKSLEKQLLRTQRLESLGTLAGGIAHDLNNLFMPILMGASLIRRVETSDATRKAVDNIERCVRRGTELVKQVLLFARGLEGSRIVIDTASIVREVESIARSTFPKNVTFVTELAPNLPMLSGDPTQLTQVLLNLCVNARDAMPAGGQITVTMGSTDVEPHYAVAHGGSGGGRYVVVEVSDTGTGIAPEIIDRIFEPFFTTKETGQGTGLGLSTTIGIVRSHGGFLTVSSEVGQGSSFKVYFPALFDGAFAAAEGNDREQELPRGEGELILVVDDERAILDITSQTLTAFGYEVLTAEDGAQALDLFVRHQSEIALVITDMGMPVIDGATLIAALRRVAPDVRIIAVSGGPADAAKVVKSGTKYFLAKPFTAETLLRTVSEVLGDETTASTT
ncbi:MAG TPA: PAS domain S-box protein [Thermoanaerobaculia bacterium]|jgi:PAS domain S-box-containing protein|nr:PAS domain S-box protein [Thermoanaerobaculia bacterium]